MKTIQLLWKFRGVVLLVFIALLLGTRSRQATEIARLSNNVETLTKNYTSYKTALGASAVKVQSLQQMLSEFKQNKPLIRTLKSAGIKPRNVLSVGTVTQQTSAAVKVVVKDSVVYRDTTKCFSFSDPYLKLEGCFSHKDTVQLQVECFDTLTYVVEKVPKQFLFIQYGVKGINLHAIAKSPYTKLTSAQYIEIK